eukprot:363295-Chlamydomonas_euryale.AAC.8
MHARGTGSTSTCAAVDSPHAGSASMRAAMHGQATPAARRALQVAARTDARCMSRQRPRAASVGLVPHLLAHAAQPRACCAFAVRLPCSRFYVHTTLALAGPPAHPPRMHAQVRLEFQQRLGAAERKVYALSK